jgi:tRNA pseudouridine55 synthase
VNNLEIYNFFMSLSSLEEIQSKGKGLILIDKPLGWSSFKVVQWLRRQTGEKRVGHAGTLDPFASGLLIVAVGREYTRQLSAFEVMDKTYETEIVLGRCTDTLDPTGQVTFEDPKFCLDENGLRDALKKWTGEICQIPPAYSAVHVQGKRAYQFARAGRTVALPPRLVTVYGIVSEYGSMGVSAYRSVGVKSNSPDAHTPILPYADTVFPKICLRIRCSRGTYIRSLARDIAAELGTQGYCENLRRIRIGDFQVENALAPY